MKKEIFWSVIGLKEKRGNFKKMKERINRINSLIQEKIAEILQREIFVEDVLITVQDVDTSEDLKCTKIKVGVIPSNRSQEVLKILEKQSPILQKELNKVIKIKFVPKISFIIDKTGEKAGRVEEILRGFTQGKKY